MFYGRGAIHLYSHASLYGCGVTLFLTLSLTRYESELESGSESESESGSESESESGSESETLEYVAGVHR